MNQGDDIRGSSGINIKWHDTTNTDFLNALQDADHILNECVGQTIRCIGVTLTETPVETTNEETGEVIVRKKHSMCLFDTNGESYVTGSNACYMSFINIAQLKGMPTK